MMIGLVICLLSNALFSKFRKPKISKDRCQAKAVEEQQEQIACNNYIHGNWFSIIIRTI